LADTHFRYDAFFRWPYRTHKRLRYRAFHLHNLLGLKSRVHATLGLSAFYYDSAAALVVDGQIIAAAQSP
jgi:hypothetical protein